MEHNQNRFAEDTAFSGNRASPPQPDRPAGATDDPTPFALPADVHRAPGSCLDFEPVALRAREDGWTPEKQRWFIEELADCGIVQEAAARVGISKRSASNLRRRDDAAGFSSAWEAAQQHGADHLRSVAYERAVTGVVKSYFYHGQKVGEDRVYDTRLLLALLARAQPIVSP